MWNLMCLELREHIVLSSSVNVDIGRECRSFVRAAAQAVILL